VSLVIEDGELVLLVRRPDDDADLPGVWGLPAATIAEGESAEGKSAEGESAEGESAEDAVRRAGREKLGVEVRPLDPLGHDGPMTDFRAEIVTGEPEVPQRGPNTQYAELRWGALEELAPAARRGSLCSQVLLRARGVEW
jgi:8-oxo-dGTP diphosphatase